MDYIFMFEKLGEEVKEAICFLDDSHSCQCTKKVLESVYKHITDREAIYRAAWNSLYRESKELKDYNKGPQGQAAVNRHRHQLRQ